VSDVKETHREKRQEERMNEPRMSQTTGGSLCLFDERGSLIGRIERPVELEPLGPGRETVYLARVERETTQPVAA
jgi:hypothetical protein